MKKSKEIVLCILVILSIFVATSLIYEFLSFIKFDGLRSLIASTIYLIILAIIYRKEIISGIKDLKKNSGKIINIGFKYWLLGIVIMVVSNLIINVIIFNGEIANNEELVRNQLLDSKVIGFISAVFVAPFLEEIIFRMSLKRVIKSKHYYVFTSALIFGSMHVITSMTSWLDLLYLVPYSALGYSFAMMNYESDNAILSVIMHSVHNAISCILIFVVLG